jgi:GrpB-like predicted nucleotidyltransferase (UPF0157 family)
MRLTIVTKIDEIYGKFIKNSIDILVKMIELVPYSHDWPHIFQKEALLIKETLGHNFIDIHHVGSTSVPGLISKDKIDIIAVVKDGDLSISPLKKAGFTYKGEWNIPFKFGFTKRGFSRINLHLFEQGHCEIELNLLFRNLLRQNDAIKDEYANLKKSILDDETAHEKHHSFLANYTLRKDQFIRRQLKKLGFQGRRFLKITHHAEWNDYHRIKDAQRLHTPIIESPSHHYFMLSHGMDTAAVAHVELLSHQKEVIRLLAVDPIFKGQGFDLELENLIQKWLSQSR